MVAVWPVLATVQGRRAVQFAHYLFEAGGPHRHPLIPAEWLVVLVGWGCLAVAVHRLPSLIIWCALVRTYTNAPPQYAYPVRSERTTFPV